MATLACGDDYFGEHEKAPHPAARAARGRARRSAPCRPRLRIRPLRLRLRALLAAPPPSGSPSSRSSRRCTRRTRESPSSAVPSPITATAAEQRRHARSAAPHGRLAEAVVSGRALGSPAAEGYVPRGFRRNELAGRPGADRAGRSITPARQARRRDAQRGGGRVRPRCAARARQGHSRLPWSRVTEAGCVPPGQPGQRCRRSAHGAGAATESSEALRLSPRDGTSRCTAASTSRSPTDPNQLVPLDTMSGLVAEGA